MAVEVGQEPSLVGAGNGETEKAPGAGDADVNNPQGFFHLRIGGRAAQPCGQGVVSDGAAGHEKQNSLGLITLGLVDGAQSGPDPLLQQLGADRSQNARYC
jgi:hypothetical protein